MTMNPFFKITFLCFSLLFANVSFSQIKMEEYVAKNYGKLYKEIINDSSFVGCRLLTATRNVVTGVELYFKDDVHYVVSFKKGRLDDGYDCDSFAIRTSKVYVIHYYKGKEYQTGYCKCNSDDQAKLIKPTIQTSEL